MIAAPNKMTCRKCSQEKELRFFRAHKTSRFGRARICLKCHAEQRRAKVASDPDAAREYRRQYDTKNKLKIQEYVRVQSAKPVSREAHRARMAVWRAKSKEKISAHYAVRKAILSGVLTRPERCSKCGGTGRIEASHNDYHRQLDVEWLCRSCHQLKDQKR